MPTIRVAARRVLNCTVAMAVSTALGAAVAASPAKPTPNTHTLTIGGQTQTYSNLPGLPAGGDVGAAYQFRTRVSYAPNCIRFANDADAAFLDGNITDERKAAALRAIQAEAQAAGCLAP